MTRRGLLRSGSAATLGFLGLRAAAQQGVCVDPGAGFGPLATDPWGTFELPRGFQYDVFSRAGDLMDDGFYVPNNHDGMAAFAGPDGTTILIRNHELGAGNPDEGPYLRNAGLFASLDRKYVYDAGRGLRPALGGTTTLIYDTRARGLSRHWLSLTGTVRNCAGGPTPWGSWLSCEESTQLATGMFEKNHGYVFDVPALHPGLVEPVPLAGLGRFNHEAVAVHEASGVLYLTEDRGDSLFYRYVPDRKDAPLSGGRLQAFAVRDHAGYDTRNYNSNAMALGTVVDARWVDLENVESLGDNLRAQGFSMGAARFSRGEGIWATRDAVYFLATDGGTARRGQVFRYVPGPDEGRREEMALPGKLDLFFEPNDAGVMDQGDNITVAPWGDLIICEDADDGDLVIGVTPEGRVYPLLKNLANNTEWAGAVFSPDGSTLFVNVQSPGATLAVWGPWERRGCV